MFLISVGLLPDNLFILTTSEQKIRDRLLEKHNLMNGRPEKAESIIKSSLDECELKLKSVKDEYDALVDVKNHEDKYFTWDFYYSFMKLCQTFIKIVHLSKCMRSRMIVVYQK